LSRDARMKERKGVLGGNNNILPMNDAYQSVFIAILFVFFLFYWVVNFKLFRCRTIEA
jgi:hypothetical protein